MKTWGIRGSVCQCADLRFIFAGDQDSEAKGFVEEVEFEEEINSTTEVF